MLLVLISQLTFLGVNPDYDRAKYDIERCEGALDDYLKQQRTRIGCKVRRGKTEIKAGLS